MKRLLAILLVVTLLITYLPVSVVLAQQLPDNHQSKKLEQNITNDGENSGSDINVENTKNNIDRLNLQVRSAVLLDVDTGQILYKKDENIPLPPASVTKVMTMLIAMEAIKSGQVGWDDIVTTSTKAHKMTGSVVFLADKEKATLKQMLEAVAVYSANDAAVAIAEHIAGTEDSFATLMNEKAKELGLKNSRFFNVTGLPYLEEYPNFNDIDGHIMSALDIAIISRELLKNHPEITDFTSIKFATFQNGVDMPTRNNLLLKHDWIDGLKTGFTNEAKYCLSATGVKNGMRLVSVILGAENDKVRQDETIKLLNYGFEHFEKQTLVRGKEEIQIVKVEKGKEREVAILASENLDIVIEKAAADEYTQIIEIQEGIIAPIEANAVLGKLYYVRDGIQVGQSINLVAKESVEKGGFFRLLARGIKDTFFGIFEGIADKFLGMLSNDSKK